MSNPGRSGSAKYEYLAGQSAVVTGGAGEICGVFCDALAAEGVRVAILDVDEARALAKAEAIQARGGAALGMGADVTSRESLDKALLRVEEEFGELSILVNGAGGNHPRATTSETLSFFDLPPEAFRRVFELNVLGTVLPSQVFGKLIVDTVKRTDGFGHIVNLSSLNAFRPLTRVPAYSAAKAAVSNFTQWLAVHLAQNYTPKVRVNAIAPGFFLTNQNRFLMMNAQTGEFTPRGQAIIAHTPAGELGRPEDLVSTLFWILDPQSRLVNGAVVPVDGGFNAYSGV